MAKARVAALSPKMDELGAASNNARMYREGMIRSTVLAGALAILTAACGPEFTSAPGGNDAGGDANGGNGGMAGTGGETSTGGMSPTGGTGGGGGSPDGGGGAAGCNPNEPDSITVESEDECFKGVQFDVGGANIVQEGSTPDSVACQTTPYCMRNLQPGGFGFLTVKNTVNGSITLRHMAEIKNPGLYALCVNDYPATPGPSQEAMREKFMSGGFTPLAANPASNPVTLAFSCPQGDWVAYRIDIQP